MTMVVRHATLDDARRIILVYQAAFNERVKPATILTKINVEDHLTLVVEDEHDVIGFLIAYTEKKTHWRLDYIGTHPCDAPKGAARALMVMFEAAAKDQGIPLLTLAVRRKNVHAQKFYERGGWVVTDERPGGFSYKKVLG